MSDTAAPRARRVAGIFEVEAARVEPGMTFATSGMTYRLVGAPIDFGCGVYSVTAEKLTGVYAGNHVTVKVRAKGVAA
jgi:hypothetical protein